MAAELRRDDAGVLEVTYVIQNITKVVWAEDGSYGFVVDLTLPGVGMLRRRFFNGADLEALQLAIAEWVRENCALLLLQKRGR